MNYKSVRTLKVIAGIVLIVAIPILFFQLMGVSILDVKESNKRVIAIVNEDLGVAKDEEAIEMGKEVTSILAKDSPYEWKVMGRGAAVNGLKSSQYEAIVYIPSDFSENIMSYDQENPQKAKFSYDVQRQKIGSKKEKVLHEIETATDRVNEKISTLYWSYVAQEMNHIKKEFTTILGKETAFLSTMSAYYEPGAETLAVEMNKQKIQMEDLLSTMGNANNAHDRRIENAESFEVQMHEFITYVTEYKSFQEKQKEVLQQIQDDSLAKIHLAATNQVKQFNETVQSLEDSNQQLNSKIKNVNEKIDANQQQFEALSDLRQNEVNRQMKDLLVVQGTAIDRYNDTVLKNLEKGIREGKSGTPVTGSANPSATQQKSQAIKKEMDQKAVAKTQAQLPGLEQEQTKIDEILVALSALKDNVTATDPQSPILPELERVSSELAKVPSILTEKVNLWSGKKKEDADDYLAASTNYGSLFENYNSLYNDYESARHLLNSYPADTARIMAEINQKEASLLAHKSLSAERKSRLEKLFALGAKSTNTEALLSYYSTLEQFKYTLDEQGQGVHKDELLKDEILTSLLKNVVDINEIELDGWNRVGEGIPESQLGMTNLSTTFAAMMSGYKETVQEQHSALLTELNSIDEQANAILTQIQTPSVMIPSGEPVASTSGEQVAASQQNTTNQLLSLSEMMSSLSNRQGSLVEYAGDLQAKANDLNETTTVFSDKWGTNVDEMAKFEDDIQGFLANTYVDGQENGYVFNHFVNPLQVKSEASVADEVKKVPPVILFIILLISSLLIGFFSHRFKEGTIGLRLGMTGILSVIVGLIVSLYSINMYVLNDERAVEWTLFTILLLLAGAALIHTALDFGQVPGWGAGIGLMCLYISPLLVLAVPEFDVPDVLSTVYMSIKYEAETSFLSGAAIVGVIAVAMLLVSFFINKYKLTEPTGAEQ
ncbi:type VII secretion protein EsaA [Filibacter tadaridae]|uniref:Type VII secretion protein EsaA n=1 Tax=Filibacter tadaridae TaxID=2483811 RepID=A0A3P5XBG7_9BACL|nr:type VII secretion protein EsaA [Filibacter tadaridae]VDC24844.1 hypothetical protein FILTAD_01107 [Filibacter tadaridae]